MNAIKTIIAICVISLILVVAVRITYISEFERTLTEIKMNCELVNFNKGDMFVVEVEEGLTIRDIGAHRTEYQIRIDDKEYLIMRIQEADGLLVSIFIDKTNIVSDERMEYRYDCDYQVDMNKFNELIERDIKLTYRVIKRVLTK